MLPFSIVIIANAIKDAYEDYKRHKSDDVTNSTATYIYDKDFLRKCVVSDSESSSKTSNTIGKTDLKSSAIITRSGPLVNNSNINNNNININNK